MAHCDSTNASAEKPTTDDGSEHCSINIDCNCIITQKSDIPPSTVLTQTLTLKAQISSDLLIEILTLSDSNEAFPPPLWNSASYSPPSLFLSNEAFLI
ncbi:MAG: hypothetical protein JJ895_04440 [Balneolaceae bacterium]|nr:hypothetical protein [Balneolaceae bacterium]